MKLIGNFVTKKSQWAVLFLYIGLFVVGIGLHAQDAPPTLLDFWEGRAHWQVDVDTSLLPHRLVARLCSRKQGTQPCRGRPRRRFPLGIFSVMSRFNTS